MISKQNGISKISINVYEGGGGREINFSSFIFFLSFYFFYFMPQSKEDCVFGEIINNKIFSCSLLLVCFLCCFVGSVSRTFYRLINIR